MRRILLFRCYLWASVDFRAKASASMGTSIEHGVVIADTDIGIDIFNISNIELVI